jgi:Xaa-Pro aminopeptidase
MVNIDICGCYNRYHTNFARSFSVGEPHPETAKRLAVSAGGIKAAKQVIRPGMPASELGRTLKAYYQEAGIWNDRWWVGGYDVGLAFAPDWVGPGVWDPDVETDRKFVPGTVVNCESDYFLPYGSGLSLIIDTMIFSDETADFAHATPPDLIVIE